MRLNVLLIFLDHSFRAVVLEEMVETYTGIPCFKAYP